ncbi:complement factor H-like isoform X3 [Puntigrus tetrazona]|uniref:complement factor H-like isoform X3 n=1 Tax=Puntigrus tetrazona TaxID=1606681 RepID=UPI001C8A0CC6|nr:complement factor H-like isoform X3 [Puntigrus tetrazona]
MGRKVLRPSVALLAFLTICQHVRAECTQPSFASQNVQTEDFLLSFSDGSTVTFGCILGHKPLDSKSSKTVTCQGTQWTNLELSCIKKSCGSLADITNGKYEMNGNLFGDTAKVVCDKGYVLESQGSIRTCRADGWDGRDPSCEVVKCTAPPSIDNGRLKDEPLESYAYLETVSYTCNGGLNLIGPASIYCSEDGTFKPDPPKCFDGCPVPIIANSKRVKGKSPPYKLGNFVEYSCENDYTMKGDGYIVCRENGWDPEVPKCIAPCTAPVLSDQLTLTPQSLSKTFPHGSKVTVKCIDGYKPNGTTSQSITCEETKWTKVTQTCIAPCTAPVLSDQLTLTKEFLSSKTFPHGSKVTVKCIDGYKPNGTTSQSITCEETKWTKVTQTCIAPCSLPILNEHVTLAEAFRSQKNFPHGSKVTVECIHGYKANNTVEPQSITCEETKWTKSPLTCIAPCSLPNLNKHVTLAKAFSSQNIFPHGSKVTVECIHGYKANNTVEPQSITCEETKWTKSLLTCIALPTSPPTTKTVTTAAIRPTSKAVPKNNGESTPVYAIVIGVIFAVGLCILIVCCCLCKRSKRQCSNKAEDVL